MENYFDWEKAKAFVYLLSEGDDDNKLAITDELLLVNHNKQKSLFLLSQIVHLKAENKKMLFPLIVGGIITPFAFLSYFTNMFLPWIHLVSMLAGMFLFYVGWSGKSSLTILLKNRGEENFYLQSISRNLWAFIDFVNNLLSNKSNSVLSTFLFFEIEKENVDTFFGLSSKTENVSFYPVLGYTFGQWEKNNKRLEVENLIIVNPMLAGMEVKFSFDMNTNQMRPQLNSPVSIASKVNISDFH